MAIYFVGIYKNDITSVGLADHISSTQKTAWLILKKIRDCFGIKGYRHVELDTKSFNWIICNN